MKSFQKLNRAIGCILLFGVAVVASGCRTVQPDFDLRAGADLRSVQFAELDAKRELDPAWLEPHLDRYQIGVGDLLEIEISEIPGSRDVTFVMPDGKVYFDLAGGVDADGLTTEALGASLEAVLKANYSHPKVNVTLREVRSRRVWMLGRVNKPGLYPLRQPTTLLEAISLAGGLFTSRFTGTTEELADLGNSFILRDGELLPVDFEALLRQGDMSQNIYLKDGDYVYMPSSLSQNLYVLGAVRQPQAIGVKDNMSLVAALAHAGGPLPSAHLRQVVIVRGSLTDPQVAVVDMSAILAGQVTDVTLEPFDIVWFPDRPFDHLERYFWTIWDTAARTIAVNEGARSVETDGDADSPIVIPIGE